MDPLFIWTDLFSLYVIITLELEEQSIRDRFDSIAEEQREANVYDGGISHSCVIICIKHQSYIAFKEKGDKILKT